MTSDLPGAWKTLEAGDAPAAVRSLRASADDLPVRDLAEFTSAVARAQGLNDLATVSEALREQPDSAQACYDFGFECLEVGAPHLAVPALRTARALAPAAAPALWELVSALEDQERHADAVRELRAWRGGLPDWPGGYLLAYNALCSGDVDTAREVLDHLSTPEDDSWDLAHDRITRMVDRAETARAAGALDSRDLRGWQFALTGSILGHLSPFGFDEGMNGRFAYLGDGYAACRNGLLNLAAVLPAMIVGMLVAGAVGVAFERVIVRPVYGQHLKQILITMGGMIIGEEIIKMLWGPQTLSLPLPDALRGALLVGDAAIEKFRLVALAVGVAVLGGMLWLLNRTKLGLLIRAGVEDREMVESLGYRIRHLFVGVFGAQTLVGLIEELSFTTVRGRLAMLLVRLVRTEGESTARGHEFTLPPNQELAAQVGTVRELISRNLSRLQAEGLIRLDGKRLIVRDVDALAASAEEI